MIALLIVALAVLAMAAVLGVKMTSRTRARKRQEELAAAQRAAEARRAEEQRKAWVAMQGDDELTSVMPAIKLPWPTQTVLEDPRGYPDLDRDYPFDRTPATFEPDYPVFPEAHPFAAEEDSWPGGGLPRAEVAAAGPRDEDYPAEEYIVPPARSAEYPSRGGDHIVPPQHSVEYPARGGEYPVRASDRAHRRVGQGSHRGGHAKRRRA
jgi:type II secretory pathway pseudopilin PulG